MDKAPSNDNAHPLDFIDEFFAMDKHAAEQHESAKTAYDRAYWQGVKDGLRKLWATINNDPIWRKIGRSSNFERPESAEGEYP